MAALTSVYHDVHHTPHPSRRVVWKAIAAYLASWVPPQSAVLEIGAGYCDWINNVRAARRVAVDIWPSLPSFTSGSVEPIVMDIARDLGTFAPASFDVVLASNVLEHFSPDVVPSIVAAIERLLRPGGRFLVIQPNFTYASRRYFDDYTHRSVFTDVSLAALLRAHGFAIERVVPRFLPYSMRGTRLPITQWLVAAYLRSPIRPMAGQMLVIASKR